jgi:hypothetical protein
MISTSHLHHKVGGKKRKEKETTPKGGYLFIYLFILNIFINFIIL